MVDGAVITVFDTAQFAVTLARADVTADAALLADARCKLHIPFAVITFRVGFVGKDPGRTNFHQVTGEFTFQRAAFRTPEVHVVVCAVNPEIRTVRIIFVVTDTTVTGDTAVHFMCNKRPQLLILMSTFCEAVFAH